MSISILDVAGPVMIGPSSSHTAGAAKLGRMAALIAGGPFHRVEFFLHGSFAKTYRGHGTDLALVAGILGIYGYDEALSRSFEIAHERGIEYSFDTIALTDVHENTAMMRFYLDDGVVREIVGSSLGGGRICIVMVDGFKTELYCEWPTLLIIQRDIPGMLMHVTTAIAEKSINIADFRCTRQGRGALACTIIETDEPIPDSVGAKLRGTPGVKSVTILLPDGGDPI